MYKRKIQGWLRHWDFMLLDELSLLVSLALAAWLRTQYGTSHEWRDLSQTSLTIALCNLIVFMAVNDLNGVMQRGYYRELVATMRHMFFTFGLFAMVTILLHHTVTFTRYFVEVLLAFYLLLSYTVRVNWKTVLRSRLKRNEKNQTMLVVTSSAYASEILQRMKKSPYAISGVVLVDRDAKGETIDDVSVVANIGDAADYLCRAWVDEVFFFHASLDAQTEALIDKCREMALTIHLYVALQGVDEKKQMLERIAGYEVLTANIHLMSEWNTFLKRVFDIVAGCFGSLAALLLMLIFGPFLYAASPGPLLYRQTRIGENGRKFTMYKLRSMYLDADRRKAEYMAENSHADGLMFKMDFDPRVIGNKVLPDGTKKRGVGDFIRRTSLDEFPQFFNVLKGDMSVVGTRPPTVDEWERYQYHHRARMSVKPGLTGLWQIHEDKDNMDFDDVVRLDTEYIANWSVGEDLRIILSTAAVMLRGLKKK